MKVDNAIFQDVESFVKRKFVDVTMEKFWIFVWENSKIS